MSASTPGSDRCRCPNCGHVFQVELEADDPEEFMDVHEDLEALEDDEEI